MIHDQQLEGYSRSCVRALRNIPPYSAASASSIPPEIDRSSLEYLCGFSSYSGKIDSHFHSENRKNLFSFSPVRSFNYISNLYNLRGAFTQELSGGDSCLRECPPPVFSSINRRETGFPNNTFVSPSNCVHESRDRCEFIEFAEASFHGGRGGTTFRGRKP